MPGPKDNYSASPEQFHIKMGSDASHLNAPLTAVARERMVSAENVRKPQLVTKGELKQIRLWVHKQRRAFEFNATRSSANSFNPF